MVNTVFGTVLQTMCLFIIIDNSYFVIISVMQVLTLCRLNLLILVTIYDLWAKVESSNLQKWEEKLF